MIHIAYDLGWFPYKTIAEKVLKIATDYCWKLIIVIVIYSNIIQKMQIKQHNPIITPSYQHEFNSVYLLKNSLIFVT